MGTETIVFGGGCFWCTEAVFSTLKGVLSVRPGYAGGKVVNPTYEQVCSGTTGHIEVIEVVFDPDVIALEELLPVFFASHDPTSIDRQGDDIGPQYNSAIFYTTDRQREKAQHYIDVVNKGQGPRFVTTVRPLEVFYPAEDYHANYFKTHPNVTYCQLIIAPKVEKVAKKFPHLQK